MLLLCYYLHKTYKTLQMITPLTVKIGYKGIKGYGNIGKI